MTHTTYPTTGTKQLTATSVSALDQSGSNKNDITFEDMKRFLQAHYKHDRLYGRTADQGWPINYGDIVVKSAIIYLVEKGYGIISRHESATGIAIRYTVFDVKNA